jgi:signal transduction histidine kinase
MARTMALAYVNAALAKASRIQAMLAFSRSKNSATGSGLSWSIVRRIAQLNRIKVQLGTSPNFVGLQVVMIWPKDRKVVS